MALQNARFCKRLTSNYIIGATGILIKDKIFQNKGQPFGCPLDQSLSLAPKVSESSFKIASMTGVMSSSFRVLSGSLKKSE